jgi:hypothetical protein
MSFDEFGDSVIQSQSQTSTDGNKKSKEKREKKSKKDLKQDSSFDSVNQPTNGDPDPFA